MTYRKALALLLVVTAIITFMLLASRGAQPPTSYLHNWNQITTLATIRAAGEGEISILHPMEVTARVTSSAPTIPGVSWADDPRFTAYEEFPLYHSLAAAVMQLHLSPELSARIVTLCLWATAALALCSLSAKAFRLESGLITGLLFVSSFPMMYYGQAVMSDMGMVAMLLVSFYCLQQALDKYSIRWVALTSIFLALSTLFKSYTAIFAPVPIIALWNNADGSRGSRQGARVVVVLSACLAVLPVIVWHAFAAAQLGNNEILSHSLHEKLTMLFTLVPYSSTFHSWQRYLGKIGGPLTLILLAVFLWRRISVFPSRRPLWFKPALLCFLVFLLLTADKIPYHDYYFLLGVPIMFPLGGTLVDVGLQRLLKRPGHRVALVAIALFVVNFVLGTRSFLKATTPNPDVVDCARAVEQKTSPGTYIATLSDRFNGIEYYSHRYGFNVENDSFPMARYKAAGAKYLVVSLPSEQRMQFAKWLAPQVGQALAVVSVVDAKSSPRNCEIYRLE